VCALSSLLSFVGASSPTCPQCLWLRWPASQPSVLKRHAGKRSSRWRRWLHIRGAWGSSDSDTRTRDMFERCNIIAQPCSYLRSPAHYTLRLPGTWQIGASLRLDRSRWHPFSKAIGPSVSCTLIVSCRDKYLCVWARHGRLAMPTSCCRCAPVPGGKKSGSRVSSDLRPRAPAAPT